MRKIKQKKTRVVANDNNLMAVLRYKINDQGNLATLQLLRNVVSVV